MVKESHWRRIERRYERKMRVAAVKRHWAHMLIWRHRANLTEVHPARYVNNLYLDTLKRSYYLDHVDGVPERKKVRIRWYDQLDGDLQHPQLEIKGKVGWTVTKQVFSLPPTHLRKLLAPAGVRNAIAANGCPEVLGEIVANLQPALVNRYHRRYFQTRDRRVRVTVDTDMSFYHADGFDNGLRPSFTDQGVILEVKFSEADCAYGAAVSAEFPLPLHKNSKYINGIQLLHGIC